jgi:hypothetical protein
MSTPSMGRANGGQINDRKSFDSATADTNGIAALYFYQQLDCLDRLAYKVAADFFQRPQAYTDLDGAAAEQRPLSEILAKLHARSGHDENYPSSAQRDQIFHAIFGRGGSESAPEAGDFPPLRNALLQAATKYAERAVETGVEMLLDRVKAAARPLTELLTGATGSSTIWSRTVLAQLTNDTCYRILQSRSVAAIFGITSTVPGTWPYTMDSNGTKLVDAVATQLGYHQEPEQRPLRRQLFSDLQWTALSGAEALVQVIRFRENSGDDEVLSLATSCYTWAAALSSLNTSLGLHPVPAEHATTDGHVAATSASGIAVYGAPRKSA